MGEQTQKATVFKAQTSGLVLLSTHQTMSVNNRAVLYKINQKKDTYINLFPHKKRTHKEI